jgi:predicted RNA-binding protein with PIN domain
LGVIVSDRLIILDGYNLILRSPHLKPGPGRTLEQAREKLLNLLAWTIGSGEARFVVVFDGATGSGGGDEHQGRVEIRFSRPPEKADDLIRRLVEREVENGRVTVVTADLEVARHARAMGADVSLADLFLASTLAPSQEAEPEKPAGLTKREIEEWAEIFKRGAREGNAEEPH